MFRGDVWRSRDPWGWRSCSRRHFLFGIVSVKSKKFVKNLFATFLLRFNFPSFTGLRCSSFIPATCISSISLQPFTKYARISKCLLLLCVLRVATFYQTLPIGLLYCYLVSSHFRMCLILLCSILQYSFNQIYTSADVHLSLSLSDLRASIQTDIGRPESLFEEDSSFGQKRYQFHSPTENRTD